MATHGMGVTFAIGDGGDPETFTAVGEVTDLSAPEWARELVETTHHGSAAKTWIAQPLVDYGEISVTVNRNPGDSTDTALKAAFASGVEGNYRFTNPGPGSTTETVTVPAIMTSLSSTSPMDAQQSMTAVLKVVGEPTVTVA